MCVCVRLQRNEYSSFSMCQLPFSQFGSAPSPAMSQCHNVTEPFPASARGMHRANNVTISRSVAISVTISSTAKGCPEYANAQFQRLRATIPHDSPPSFSCLTESDPRSRERSRKFFYNTRRRVGSLRVRLDQTQRDPAGPGFKVIAHL